MDRRDFDFLSQEVDSEEGRYVPNEQSGIKSNSRTLLVAKEQKNKLEVAGN